MIFFSIFIFPTIILASTEIYFQNESKQILAGDVFSIDLKISSVEKSINVIDGTILFDKDKLKVKNIEKDSSILSLWIKEPVFDNKLGFLSFIGGIPEGFKSHNGQIFKINFVAKSSGESTIQFQDIFKVYENDGLGTQINPSLRPVKISINQKDYLKNVSEYVFVMNQNYIYYAVLCILFVLFIIIRLYLKFKKNNEK